MDPASGDESPDQGAGTEHPAAPPVGAQSPPVGARSPDRTPGTPVAGSGDPATARGDSATARGDSAATRADAVQAPAQAGDEQQERDVWWGSYAGRTMLPSFAVCVLLTAAIAAAAWYIWETHEAQPQLAREVAYAGAAAVWVIQLLRLGYRTITINYRLTTRRLFRDRGFYVPTEAVELARVTSVAVEPRALVERLVGVGRLRVVSENGTLPTFTLEGVYQPERVATEIRRWVRRAREKNKSIKAEGMFTPAVEVGRQETNKAG